MDLEEIKNIIALMKEHELSYFNLETEDTKIKLKRGADLDELERALASATPAPAPAPRAAKPAPSEASSEDEDEESAAAADGTVAITSPMVGTFYRAGSPEDPPFADIGTRVSPDTVVCIIESMKVMNEIQAEVSGTVIEVLAQNTDAVQYGEPLFRIKTD